MMLPAYRGPGASGHPPAIPPPTAHRPARVPRAGQVSAARVMVLAFGAGAALLGLEPGVFEMRQGTAAPGGLVIHAIGPPCQPHTAWHGCEPAMTVIPTFLGAGIAAMVLAVVVLIWSAVYAGDGAAA